jgi:succinate-semialdehyde dehydrogenase/glutarate-semialdehyde dehydrogenase
MSALESKNPATGEVVGTLAITPTGQIPQIVEAARAALPRWSELGLQGRAKLLKEACTKHLGEHSAELAQLLTKEMGKPLKSALSEVKGCSKSDRVIDEMVQALQDEVFDDGRTHSTLYRDPFGVCAAITPWNFPISMPHWMCLPALMAGNTVVLKPSEETPLIAQAIVHGADEQGKALVASNVDLIAFTGSREVGKAILGAASKDLKRVVLELGGKDPMIVLEGADLKKTAKFAATNSMFNSGQVCVSTERIYVNKKDADEFVEHLCQAVSEMTIGNGMDESTFLGPMINSRQRDHVMKQVKAAVDQGATIAFGGEFLEKPPENEVSSFLKPTVLRGVTHEMAIAHDETFGPVACVIEVDDAQHALRLANDTKFGLGATVFGPEEAALAIGRQLKAGMIGVNKGCGGAAGTPWVGAQESGYGFHGGVDGHRQFAQVRVVSCSL